ncbi:oxygen-insensitive NADPH nitroreductase [Cohnella rhizosphaerae]|uniref:Oxygen-insensitive NADPH nitroreductase n=1 Tax=Cohnella rhizosphaerae TaxID=1457232 RepID=A0A9X4KPX4_9BACL|nr:oxygen-insensitive NADPH nitroreductase [Cohnella rhizosphaerae]MDG0808710.1 oxygen-insensitive NADPH nitroreductase [Cohnella rhizosphaerae]
MNEMVAQLMQHRSVRSFDPSPVPEADLREIVAAGQMASTSSNVQAYSVIAVTDPALKRELSVLTGNQAYVESCPVFLVWCADLNRLSGAAEAHLEPGADAYADSAESFIVATVDAALAAQNAAIAAESMGYGICYIGGIRNRIEEVSNLLGIPGLAYPVFGMCVGLPDQPSGQRPRLPVEAVLHRNRYDAEKGRGPVAEYDETMTRYLRMRTDGRKSTPWTRIMAEWLTRPNRLHMLEYLKKRGFLKR